MRRRRKTEGVLFHLSPDAFSTALGEAFEILEQRAHSAQPREKLSERAGAVGLMQAAARRVDERQAKDLADAQVRRVAEVFETDRVFQPADDFGKIIARDLAQPRDGVEREQDAQEGQQRIDHGLEYDVSSEAGGIWRGLSPIFLGQVIEIRREDFPASKKPGAPLSPNPDVILEARSAIRGPISGLIDADEWVPALRFATAGMTSAGDVFHRRHSGLVPRILVRGAEGLTVLNE